MHFRGNERIPDAAGIRLILAGSGSGSRLALTTYIQTGITHQQQQHLQMVHVTDLRLTGARPFSCRIAGRTLISKRFVRIFSRAICQLEEARRKRKIYCRQHYKCESPCINGSRKGRLPLRLPNFFAQCCCLTERTDESGEHAERAGR